ncbi:IclR family transcriptional regulator [Limosilactobacillus sp. STM2_1]|uniref:IclR family transcriptional regulator n=1 Tax=Limosilactobacillus rudii TaxID=2759755 RepID=A0A7W3YMX7_9LACO|nr:IclR family transcriptional regulator [Limosilactobacillus rudii]MBB1078695.1 IclR family transcriptional regulator [Limosilactobacillus rudii]MBB1096737.1 IclR family transcriptional regulator [Limosilactobacillus rudii]MCD7135591.1 IclR family transcriptional regulator [Limosilactobacillus rudii]
MENKLYGAVLLKARQILDYIASTDEAPTLRELDEHLDISKPTIYKILKTLEYCGYIRVEGEDKHYYLGTIFLQYAQAVNNSFDIEEIARPYLKQLRDATRETVNLGIIEDNSVVLLSKLESTNSIKLVSYIGGKMHMYSSAMGKAVLATYNDKQLSEYLNDLTFEKLTPNTIDNTQRLMEDINNTRRQGYSIDDIENQPGVYCLGFSLVKNGHVLGAFSISTPEYRMDDDKKKQFVTLGQQTQQQILSAI